MSVFKNLFNKWKEDAISYKAQISTSYAFNFSLPKELLVPGAKVKLWQKPGTKNIFIYLSKYQGGEGLLAVLSDRKIADHLIRKYPYNGTINKAGENNISFNIQLFKPD